MTKLPHACGLAAAYCGRVNYRRPGVLGSLSLLVLPVSTVSTARSDLNILKLTQRDAVFLDECIGHRGS